MIQHQIRHDPATFPRCAGCDHEPRHIEARGSHSGEDFDVLRPTGDRHRLECRCDARTAWFPTLELALKQWRESFAVPARRASADVRPLLRLHRDAR